MLWHTIVGVKKILMWGLFVVSVPALALDTPSVLIGANDKTVMASINNYQCGSLIKICSGLGVSVHRAIANKKVGDKNLSGNIHYLFGMDNIRVGPVLASNRQGQSSVGLLADVGVGIDIRNINVTLGVRAEHLYPLKKTNNERKAQNTLMPFIGINLKVF